MLQGKKIVVGVTGSIAAFKAALLVRLLKKEGADVKVMMTEAARDFITPLTLSTLSGYPVIIAPFNPDDGSWNSHVDLGRWADAYVLAPVTANTLAKMANGIADNFFVTAYLSAKCPVFFAPAMDLDMYRHPSTKKNVETLIGYGNILIEPATGELASGLTGPGRMEEPELILEALRAFFNPKTSGLSGKKVLVTAGPTHEAIDPVRYIGNHSSGLMGFEIAEAFAEKGAEVTLVTGPVSLETRTASIRRIMVTSAEEMYMECTQQFQTADITVMAAAVADFRPASPSSSKIKKSGKPLILELEPTTDILSALAASKKAHQLLAGFALETDREEEHARKKLEEKNLDLIILNSLNDPGAGFKSLTNKISVFFKDGQTRNFSLKPKRDVARDIVDIFESMI